MFSYVDLEERTPERHPLGKIQAAVNDVLRSPNAEFDRLCADGGRSLIALERSIRREQQQMEQVQYNLLLRRFVGLGIDDPVRGLTVFTKNRDRLLNTEMARKVIAAILAHRDVNPLLSDGYFSVDDTLVKAWTWMKSFRPKVEGSQGDDDPGDPLRPDTAADDQPATTKPDPMPRTKPNPRNAEVDFRGDKLSNATLALTTDPDARLYKKAPGTGAALCFIGYALTENRSGLIVQADLPSSGREGRIIIMVSGYNA